MGRSASDSGGSGVKPNLPVARHRISRRRRALFWAILLSPIYFPFALFYPFFPGVVTYRPDGADWRDRISVSEKQGSHIIKDGKLYLLRQETWHALVLVTGVRTSQWSKSEIDDLVRRLPPTERAQLTERPLE